MERKIITEEKKNILISQKEHFEAYMTDKGAFYSYDTPGFKDFCELVEADCDTLCRLGLMYHGEIGYKVENGLYIVTCLMMKDGCIVDSLSMELECDDDFLGLFEKKENDKEADDFFDDSIDDIIAKMKNEHADVYEGIVEDVLRNIRDYDLEDSVKEDIAKEWIEDNPCDAVSVAEDYIGNDDMKDIIIRWFDRNF